MLIQQRWQGLTTSLGKGGTVPLPSPQTMPSSATPASRTPPGRSACTGTGALSGSNLLGTPSGLSGMMPNVDVAGCPFGCTSTGATSPSGAGALTSAPTTATMTTGGDDPGDGSGVERDDGNYKDLRIPTTIPSIDYCLTSRVRSSRDNCRHPSNGIISTIDWVHIFRVALSSPQLCPGGCHHHV
jgi:hypothetical protein